MALDRDPNHVLRDFVIPGMPSSGKWKVHKPEFRALLTEWWQVLIGLVADAGDLELPNLLINMTVDPDESDANNLVAEANLPAPETPGLALFSILTEGTNTGPVRVNGKRLLTNSGKELPAGGLVEGGLYLFLDNGDSYRLMSDYASAALVAAAEQAVLDAGEQVRHATTEADRSEAAATVASGLASAFIIAENTFATRATAEAWSPASAPDYIRTGGYHAAGDGGGALYRLVSSEPGHAGKLRIANGAWYEIAEKVLTPAMFGAMSDGVIDDSIAIQTCHDVAYAIGGKWHLDPLHFVNTTVTISYGALQGAPGKTEVLTRINDGSPVFYILSTAAHQKHRDVTINYPDLNFNGWLEGTHNVTNCIGFKFGDTPTNTNRIYLEHLYSRGLEVGYDLRGFIVSTNNLWANCCGLGFRGDTLNAADLNLRIENCRKDFELFSSTNQTYGAVLFRQLLAEGGKKNVIAASIDKCRSVTFDTPYWEQSAGSDRAEPYLKVGFNEPCQQVRILNMSCSVRGQEDVPGLAFDRVDGLEISGYRSGFTFQKNISTTKNTRNVKYDIADQTIEFGSPSTPWLLEDSGSIGTAWNYFPNRNFSTWFRGWSNVSVSRATVSKETSILRRGSHHLRLQAVAGQNSNYIEFRLEEELAIILRGMTLRLGAWMYVPSIPEYPNNESGRSKYVGIILQSYNGSSITASPNRNSLFVSGSWQFFYSEFTIPNDAIRVAQLFYVNQSSNNATGNEFILLDEATLCDVAVPLPRQMAGEVIDHPALPVFVGGRVQEHRASAPTDADQIYEVGDIIWNTTVAAGGSPGWVCTTGGPGGTAVFKAMANLAA